MCNCRISKSCVRCVLGAGDLSSNSYSGVFMTAFLMINVLLVNLLERFDTGKNKNCVKYHYVVYMHVHLGVHGQEESLFTCVHILCLQFRRL